MFDFFKKKTKEYADVVGAPLKGEAIESAAVNDPTFAEEMLGKGMAIKPSEGKVYAPFDGTVAMVFDTKHAVSLVSDKGTEVLIHVGLDTVMLKGEHYTAHVESGASVKKGDLLLEFDMEAIAAAGYDTVTPVVVCNADDYKDVIRTTGKQVEPGDVVMELDK
ncbi:MAG: PTS glucose transporter subunit IIA [Lachnospiraceae bacterium]|nr:PTS glucose transporter subunit IIA [Agathobacter sp.]MBQ3162959.1 PTS glucose transporter subunit IIA [Lachnospiraceae bacterium]